MAKALRIFTVSYNGIRLRIRIMPHTRDVYSVYREGSKWRMNQDLVRAFFRAYSAPNSKFLGEIVLAGNEKLTEIISHEVVHAVLYKFKTVHTDTDESFATTIGILTDRIYNKVKRNIQDAK